MFPQADPQQGKNGPTTSSMVQQNTGLLGAPPVQTTVMAQGIPSFINNTAPASSTTNPMIASMVKALKG